jgi:transposase
MRSQRKQYSSDLSDNQWLLIKKFIPQCISNKKTGGRPEKYSRREILNTILYVLGTGCGWNDTPHDLPPGGIAWYWFNKWSQERVFVKIARFMRKHTRITIGKDEVPTLLIIDSQTTKSTANTSNSGYDAGKKTKGRKRHHVTDINGIIIHTKVHSAAIQDRDGAKLLLSSVPKSIMDNVQKIIADGGYSGKLIGWVKKKFNIVLEIVKRNELHKFVVLPKRWIIERTNAWMYGAKRLAKECEQKIANQESMIYLRMSQILLRRVI